MRPNYFVIALILFLTYLLPACSSSTVATNEKELIALGERLFHDKSLSSDGTVSCASCHSSDRSFADGRPVSIGAHARQGTRNAPSLLDSGSLPVFFWDGRETQLGAAVMQPFANPMEMGLSDTGELTRRIGLSPAYRALGISAGHTPVRAGDIEKISAALSAYVRSLRSPDSRFEQHLRNPGSTPLTPDEQAGLSLFRGKAECSACHSLEGTRPELTDHRFHHTGVGFEQVAGNVAAMATDLSSLPRQRLAENILARREIAELGRFAATRRAQDLGAFRTPTLRNVADTAPYMHDGSIATLEEAVQREIYYRSLARGRPLDLTVEEQRKILAFLRSLSPPSPSR